MTMLQCPLCTSTMALRNGKYGQFYGCIRYPECRATMTVAQANAGTIDANTIRRKAESAVQRERDKRAGQVQRTDAGMAAWRAAKIAADTSTEPPFDPTPEIYEPPPSELDREFQAMFR